MNQEVAERAVSAEGRKGQGLKDVTGGGITLKVVEMSENDVLDAEDGGMKGNNQENSFFLHLGEGESRTMRQMRCW